MWGAQTTRMLAQKQPFIKRVRNSSLVERPCAEDFNGAKLYTEAWDAVTHGRRAFMRGEVRAKALVDCIQVRMPE